MNNLYVIKRDQNISAKQIGELRHKIGWESLVERFENGCTHSYAQFSIREGDILVGFARVISDGSLYAFIVDVMIHPKYQQQGLGKNLITHIVRELKQEKIRLIQLVYSSELEHFYKSCGFSLLMAGTILNDTL